MLTECLPKRTRTYAKNPLVWRNENPQKIIELKFKDELEKDFLKREQRYKNILQGEQVVHRKIQG